MDIGFIGLGIMGSGMVSNLLKAGHQVTVYNRDANKAAPFVSQGARQVASVADVAAGRGVVITMLAHPEAVRSVAAELLPAMDKGSLWIDSSTTNPSFVREMAALAGKYSVLHMDAPVAGSKHQAAGAQLVFFCGGEQNEIALATPLFEAMGQRTVHVGGHAMGTSLKLVINHLLATSMAAFGEGLALGEALGLSREMLLEVLVGGVVTAPYMSAKKDKLASGEYDAEFPLKWMHKDMQMVAQAAYENGIAMPLANLTKEVFQAAIVDGLGEFDFSAVGK